MKPRALEGLERREVLSGVAVAPFASLPGRLTGPGQSAHVGLKIAHGQISSDRAAPVYVELSVRPAPGSSALPDIADVVGPTGMVFPVRKAPGGPFLFRMTAPAGNPKAYAVDVVSQDGRAGDFILNASLAGDVNASGAVDDADLQRIKSVYGTRAGMPRYDPAADLNGDGRVGCVDLTVAKANLGAQASVVPVWTAPAPAATAARPVVAPTPTPTPTPVAAPVAAPLVTVPVQTAPVVPVVYYQPVGTVPVYAQPQPVTTPLVAQPWQYAPAGYTQPVGLAPLYGYGQQGGQVPVYAYGQQGGQVPVYAYGQQGGQVPVYAYGQQGGQVPVYAYGLTGNQVPVYTYGQPVVQGPVVSAPAPAVGTGTAPRTVTR